MVFLLWSNNGDEETESRRVPSSLTENQAQNRLAGPVFSTGLLFGVSDNVE